MAIKIGGTTVVDNSRNLVDVINIDSSGISTLGTVVVNSGIITSTEGGIVTYYGDGSKLENIVSGVGISTIGGLVGTGATILDFRGTGISTITVSSGIATINIVGTSGGGGGTGEVGVSSDGVSQGTFTNLNFVGAAVTSDGATANVTVNKTFTIGLRSGAQSLNVTSGIATIQLRDGIGSIYF
jgi:hypothetical protein